MGIFSVLIFWATVSLGRAAGAKPQMTKVTGPADRASFAFDRVIDCRPTSGPFRQQRGDAFGTAFDRRKGTPPADPAPATVDSASRASVPGHAGRCRASCATRTSRWPTSRESGICCAADRSSTGTGCTSSTATRSTASCASTSSIRATTTTCAGWPSCASRRSSTWSATWASRSPTRSPTACRRAICCWSRRRRASGGPTPASCSRSCTSCTTWPAASC